MAPGFRRHLLLHLGAAVSCLCLLAASRSVDAAPLPPSRGVPAPTTVVAPAPAAVPRTAVDDDDAGVPTMAAPDGAAAAVFFFRGARRLGPPRHLVRLSGIPADAPAAAPSDVHHAAARQSLVVIFGPVFFVLGCGLFVAGLFKSADLYAAAKARRVRPLGQDAVDAAAGP